MAENTKSTISRSYLARASSMEDCHAFWGVVTGNAHGMDHALVHFRFRVRLSPRPKKPLSSRSQVAALEMAEKRWALSNTIVKVLNTINSLVGKSMEVADNGNERSRSEGTRKDFRRIKNAGPESYC